VGKKAGIHKQNMRDQHREVLTSLVVPLVEGNFSSFINSERHSLVEFYAPWCGHCKKLAPIWHEFAFQVSQDPLLSLNVQVGKIDGDSEKELAEKYNIASFPTILHFPKRDRPSMYEAERTVEAFMKYVARLAKPPTMQRIYAFDLLAREFYNAAGDTAKQEEVMGRANRTAQHFGKSQKVAAEMYVKLMERALAKSGGAQSYFDEEAERVERLILTKLPAEKTRELLLRRALVSSFMTEVAAPGIQMPVPQRAEGDEAESDLDDEEAERAEAGVEEGGQEPAAKDEL